MEALHREIERQDKILASFLPPEEIAKYRVTILSLLQQQQGHHQQQQKEEKEALTKAF